MTSPADAGEIRAFLLEPLSSVVLHRGTWHWGPFPVAAESVTLFNVQGRRYAEDNDRADLAALDAPVDVLFRAPRHPYTEGLMASMPPLEGGAGRLYAIPGRIPDPDEPIAGCRFGPRCAHVEAICRAAPPQLLPVGEAHRVRCTPRTCAEGLS